MAKEFLKQVVARARAAALVCDEHFTVDGTLLEAWAGLKSFHRKIKRWCAARNPTVDFSWPEAVERNACIED